MKDISPNKLHSMLNEGASLLVVDVRTPDERAWRRIAGTEFIPLQQLEIEKIREALGEDGERPVCFVCKSGARSRIAASRMEKAGLSNTLSLEGGIDNWVASGYKVEQSACKTGKFRWAPLCAGAALIGMGALQLADKVSLNVLLAALGLSLVFYGLTGKGFCCFLFRRG